MDFLAKFKIQVLSYIVSRNSTADNSYQWSRTNL